MLPPGIQTKWNPFQVHTHQATIKLAYRANFDSMCLVTDAIGALGLKDGVYTLGQQQIQARCFGLLSFFTIAMQCHHHSITFVFSCDRWLGCKLLWRGLAHWQEPLEACGLAWKTYSIGPDAASFTHYKQPHFTQLKLWESKTEKVTDTAHN